ncbi:MAG: DUF721 domain-containing protein [Flavobacteriales bacterium]
MSYKNENQKPLAKYIEYFIEKHKMKEKMNEVDISESWEKIMGKPISIKTKKVQLKNGILSVYLESSVLRGELSYGKEKIKRLVNEHFGREFVEEVRLK